SLDVIGECRQIGDGCVNLRLQGGQLTSSRGKFGRSGIGDRIDLAATSLGVADESFGLHPRQTRGDGAGGGGGGTEEANLQQPDQLIPVLRPFGEQLEQVEPQAAVAEDGGHASSPKSASTGRRNNAMLPPTAVASRRPEPVPRVPLTLEPHRPSTDMPGKSL